MKTTALVAVLLLTITSVNAKTTVFAAKEGGSQGHGYTSNAKSGEGVRPFKASFEGIRGGVSLDGGGASSGGGFHDADEGGGVSGGGYQSASEGGHTGNG